MVVQNVPGTELDSPRVRTRSLHIGVWRPLTYRDQTTHGVLRSLIFTQWNAAGRKDRDAWDITVDFKNIWNSRAHSLAPPHYFLRAARVRAPRGDGANIQNRGALELKRQLEHCRVQTPWLLFIKRTVVESKNHSNFSELPKIPKL